MKEIIVAVVFAVGIFTGNKVLKEIHIVVQKAALEKASKGIRPLPRFAKP